MAALTSAWRSGARGADPDTASRSRRRSAARPARTSRWYMVGTPKNKVACSAATASATAAGSNPGSSTAEAPADKVP